MDISYKKSRLEDRVDNCTTFDELTPNAYFERVVLDLSNQAGGQESKAISQVFLSFKEEVEDAGARSWFDLLDQNSYAGMRVRLIQSSNQDITEKMIKFSQELTDDRQSGGFNTMSGRLSENNPDYINLFTPSLALGMPIDQIGSIYIPYEGTRVYDCSLAQLLDQGSTYMEQREENAAIIKSFEMSISLGENIGEYFPPNANQGNEHLSYFIYIYVDLNSAAEEYGLDLDLRNRANLFPYGQISFVNVLGDYRTGLEMSQTGSGPGKELLCDLRQLRRFRQETDISEIPFRDSLSAIRNAVGALTERGTNSPFGEQRSINAGETEMTSFPVDPDGIPNSGDEYSITMEQDIRFARENLISAKEIDKLTGDQGHFTEFWHSKDQKDNIRFIFGLDNARLARNNCSYPILLTSHNLVLLSGIENPNVFELKDLKVKKARLRDDSVGTTSLGGNTKFDVFDENTDYTYVAGFNDNANPVYHDGRAKFIEDDLERESESSDVKFFSGKDNLKKHPTDPGVYKYRVETTHIDHSPKIIKALAKRLDRQAFILRRAYNQIAGRQVFNEEFVEGSDQPGAIATRTMGGFFLKEQGTNLQIQEQEFSNIREAVTPAAMVVANIAEELNILAGTIERNARHRPRLGQVIGYLLGQIRPDATGQSLNMLEEITGFAEYLADHFRKSVNRALVNFTSDEYKGTSSSGTGSDVVGGKRIIRDIHDFSEIVDNLKTKQTGIDLVSWWEQNDQDKGLKAYDYDLYVRRVKGEVSKFYAEGYAPLLDNLWTYMTPALIKLAGRDSVSPYDLGNRTRPSMYSYNAFANFHADLYDYKFNSKHTQPYHLYESTYSEHDKTKDRLRPDTYQNKTIKQILNQHCEIEISAIDEKYRDEDGEPVFKKPETTTPASSGLYQIFGAPDGTADETTAASVEAAFGDLAAQKKKIIEDYHVSVTSKEPKTFVPKVTRIFYTLMGEMVLTPSPAEYADARYNSFAGIEDQIADDTGSAVRAESQEDFEARQERLREELEAAEDALEEARRNGGVLANRLHEEDIERNRRPRDQGPPDFNNEPYPIPSLMDRLDPLYVFARYGSWSPVLNAERQGYFGVARPDGRPPFLDEVRQLPTQEERVDEVCRFVTTEERNRQNRAQADREREPEGIIEQVGEVLEDLFGDDDVVVPTLERRETRAQLRLLCEELRTNANTRREQEEVDRLRDELAERPPTLGDIRDVGPRQRGLPIQLQALTDMANYIANRAMGDGGGNALLYNQPVLTGDPYTEIPIDKSMLAISDINGNSVTLANVYDVMKDHSKFAPFWYNFKNIHEIQYLVGFDANIREPIWRPLTEQVYTQDVNTGAAKPVLCRVVSYDNQAYGVSSLGTTSLPVYNKYFFLEKSVKASVPPDEKDYGGPFMIDPSFTPGEIFVPEFNPSLPPGISTTPASGLDLGGDTGFFGGVPRVTIGGNFSNLEFDFSAATNAGIINPRTNISTVVSSVAINPNVGSNVSANAVSANAVSANTNFNGSGY